MSTRKLTFAILYTGNGYNPNDPGYVTPMELEGLKNQTGYGYCCPCKETLQFDSKADAEKYCERKGIPLTTHEIVDSDTAKKRKATRKPKPAAVDPEEAALAAALDAPAAPVQAPTKSALTGKAVKWK